MNDIEKSTAFCKDCNAELPVSHSGSCPECGGLNKIVKVSLIAKVVLSAAVNWEKRVEYWERNPRILTVVIVLSILSPFIGLYIIGIPGALIGLTISVLLLFLSLKAVTKVREVTKGGSKD
jgi:hypothetical protein